MLGIVLLSILVIVIAVVLRALTAYRPPASLDVPLNLSGPAPATAGVELTLTTWNLGYAGLGRDADFVADGGRRLRPRSRQEVEANLAAITAQLQRHPADVLLLQELARACFLTRGVDVLAAVAYAVEAPAWAFTPTVSVTGLPVVGDLTVGKGTFSRFLVRAATRQALATAADAGPLVLQHFNVLETRLPAAGEDWEWVLLNIHLSAFDDGELRRRQLAAVVAFMDQEYRAGHRVVAGGDWNLLLAATEFPHTTAEKDRFWVRHLPPGVVPANWIWAVDPSVPTCRTLERPYQAGENYTCVIDGFLVTPNVEVLAVEATDLQFANSDHQPVTLQVRARP